jgi:hypothetical protein
MIEKSPSKESKIVLCADDYGMTIGISRAMLELADGGKLSAISAMTNLPAWRDTYQELRKIREKVSVGLHLNLTVGEPLTNLKQCMAGGQFQSLQHTLFSSVAGRWSRSLLKDEINAQLDRFESAVNAAPDHVDGHQHVHVFPSIRPILLQCLAERYGSNEILFRIPSPELRDITAFPGTLGKSFVIKLLSSGSRKAAVSEGMIVNDSFAGFSAFKEEQSFETELMAAFDQGRGGIHLVMCHPGYVSAEIAQYDSVIERREQERACLMCLPIERFVWVPKRDSSGRLDWSAAGASVLGGSSV